MWERNQDDTTDLCLESRGQQVREPLRVGHRKELFGAWKKQPAGEVNNHVGPGDHRRQRRGITEIRFDRTHVVDARHVVRQRRAMVHQPQLMRAGHQLTREETTQVSCGTGDQNRASVLHVSSRQSVRHSASVCSTPAFQPPRLVEPLNAPDS